MASRLIHIIQRPHSLIWVSVQTIPHFKDVLTKMRYTWLWSGAQGELWGKSKCWYISAQVVQTRWSNIKTFWTRCKAHCCWIQRALAVCIKTNHQLKILYSKRNRRVVHIIIDKMWNVKNWVHNVDKKTTKIVIVSQLIRLIIR